ncbi:hypothetical protein [Motilibacter aurantiacus]|uniref:hypothetical protein n=1 Tax=Motilibacter aurantiacus TaxID=2714955 RepID=UPI00140C48EE|nr:hypothetical protein [Motilibacter aurantiacus]NHC43697.1 hypothetical protein [Motilibacter aurantiacus]
MAGWPGDGESSRPDGPSDRRPEDAWEWRVPDDARELEPDRQAWLREQRERARASTRSPGRRRLRAALPFLVIAALVLALSAPALLLSPQAPRGTLPLAARHGRVATVGGLLPDVQLQTLGARATSARNARAAVVVVLPSGGCDCHPLVLDVVGRARAVGVYPWLVSSGNEQLAADEFAIATRRARGVVAQDPGALLWRALGASEPTLVLVHADGIIAAIEPADRQSLPALGQWLDEQLPGLLRPGPVPDTAHA